MKLYLVRHGETPGNVQNFYQTAETPLTENGIEQAKKVSERFVGQKIDFIYSSTHLRARHTSQIISDKIGVPIETWEDLMEIKRPKEVRGKAGNDPEADKIMQDVILNFANNDWKYSDEENFFDLKARAEKVLGHLSAKHPTSHVICVSHGTFIKFLVATALFGENLTPEIFSTLRSRLQAENTGISVIDYNPQKGFKLHSWNDSSHL